MHERFSKTGKAVLIATAALLAAGVTYAQSGKPRLGLGGAKTAAAVRTMPLAEHPQGQQMMSQAGKNASLLEVNFKFLDKTYEDDKYVREPITGKKVRTSCVRFRATSGFKLKLDMPTFRLTGDGVTISQNISRIAADGLRVKFQLGPCMEHSTGVGIHMRDIKVTYKARPQLTFDQNNICKLKWNLDQDSTRVTIGDFNIIGVQNDLDKLAKKALRDGLNAMLDGFYGSMLPRELEKITFNVCGTVKAGG